MQSQPSQYEIESSEQALEDRLPVEKDYRDPARASQNPEANLASLPLELLDHICSYLAVPSYLEHWKDKRGNIRPEFGERKSLQAVCLVNKLLYVAATPHLYRHLILTTESLTFSNLLRTLVSTSLGTHVRKYKYTKRVWSPTSEDDNSPTSLHSLTRCWSSRDLAMLDMAIKKIHGTDKRASRLYSLLVGRNQEAMAAITLALMPELREVEIYFPWRYSYFNVLCRTFHKPSKGITPSYFLQLSKLTILGQPVLIYDMSDIAPVFSLPSLVELILQELHEYSIKDYSAYRVFCPTLKRMTILNSCQTKNSLQWLLSTCQLSDFIYLQQPIEKHDRISPENLASLTTSSQPQLERLCIRQRLHTKLKKAPPGTWPGIHSLRSLTNLSELEITLHHLAGYANEAHRRPMNWSQVLPSPLETLIVNTCIRCHPQCLILDLQGLVAEISSGYLTVRRLIVKQESEWYTQGYDDTEENPNIREWPLP
jgi:hypothetical protein